MSKHIIVTPLRTYINPRLVQDKRREWKVEFTYRDPGASRGYSGREVLGPLTRIEAETAFAAWKDAIGRQSLDAAPVTILSQILTPYETSLKLRQRKAVTNLVAIRILRTAIGHLPIAGIDNGTLEEFQTGRRIQPQTLRRYVGVLNAAFQHARHDGKLALADMRKFKLPPQGARRTWFLDAEQAAEFLARAYGDSIGRPRLTLITKLTALALATGARKAALEDLTFDRIDLTNNRIDFRVPGAAPAPNKKRVVIKIRADLRPMLERALRERRPGQERFLGVRDVDQPFRTWLEAQEDWRGGHLGKAHLHGFRHTFVTLLLRGKKHSIKEIATLVGDTARMIEDVYAHEIDSHEIDF